MKIKELLAISIIFLFIGVAVAPSINFNVVKASSDKDLIEVTSQACGIQGFGNTTVKLTKQQYKNLEQYLVDFRARLNQTTTTEEAVPIFKEAVVELNKCGLLPKGMNVGQVQNFVTGDYQNIKIPQIFKEKYLKNQGKSEGVQNYLCLITGQTSNTLIQPLLTTAITLSEYPLLWPYAILAILDMFHHLGPLLSILLDILTAFDTWIGAYMKFSMELQKILVGANIWLINSNGWVNAIGLTGKQSINGSVIGLIPIHGLNRIIINNFMLRYTSWHLGTITRGAIGFTGFRLSINQTSHESYYLGSALWVDISNN